MVGRELPPGLAVMCVRYVTDDIVRRPRMTKGRKKNVVVGLLNSSVAMATLGYDIIETIPPHRHFSTLSFDSHDALPGLIEHI